STCKSASQSVLSVHSRMLTFHATRRTPHGASRLVLAMFARSVKTRRPPSQHCRDAMGDGHTTTAMHDNEYTPPTPREIRWLSTAHSHRRHHRRHAGTSTAMPLSTVCLTTLSSPSLTPHVKTNAVVTHSPQPPPLPPPPPPPSLPPP
ncbi:unnamed protein product, partial [Laminaria digitata]